jgi:hypothetical protein
MKKYRSSPQFKKNLQIKIFNQINIKKYIKS